jgi:hypothetical protein
VRGGSCVFPFSLPGGCALPTHTRTQMRPRANGRGHRERERDGEKAGCCSSKSAQMHHPHPHQHESTHPTPLGALLSPLSQSLSAFPQNKARVHAHTHPHTQRERERTQTLLSYSPRSPTVPTCCCRSSCDPQCPARCARSLVRIFAKHQASLPLLARLSLSLPSTPTPALAWSPRRSAQPDAAVSKHPTRTHTHARTRLHTDALSQAPVAGAFARPFLKMLTFPRSFPSFSISCPVAHTPPSSARFSLRPCARHRCSAFGQTVCCFNLFRQFFPCRHYGAGGRR